MQVAIRISTGFQPGCRCADYLHVFDYHGRRVTRGDMGFDAWQQWQAELCQKLSITIAFFYGNFVAGTRRAVIDGIEPIARPSESIQFELFEYVYHQILRKESDWVARDLFREHFRDHAALVEQHLYPTNQVSCLLLYTSPIRCSIACWIGRWTKGTCCPTPTRSSIWAKSAPGTS